MSTPEVTQILTDPAIDADERAKKLLPLVYAQLRAAAENALAGERPGHTLQATALVHEAYVKLAGGREMPWQSRAHFYVAAADAIRQILLDHAKARARVKRGGGVKRVSLEIANLEELAEADPATAMSVDQAFRRLEAEDPRAAMVVRLRVYAGLTAEEVGLALGVSSRTVEREWAFARRWLARELLADQEADGSGTGQGGS